MAPLSRPNSRGQIWTACRGLQPSDYDRLRRVYNAVVERRPGAIVQAATVSDVQKVVRIAADSGLPLAVRCGGHSFAGLGTCDDGIVCDLSRMNSVLVDPQARTVDVGGGALLGDVDAAGERYGLVTPAGVVSHTGVGGLTLGGGMGYLSRRFGLTIDSLVGADIVTADGRLRVSRTKTRVVLGDPRRRRQLRRRHQVPVPHARSSGPCRSGAGPFRPARGRTLTRYRDAAAEAPREVTTAFIVARDELRLRAISSGPTAGEDAGSRGLPSREGSGSQDGSDVRGAPASQRRVPAVGPPVLLQGRIPGGDGRSGLEVITNAVEEMPVPGLEVYCLQLGGAVATSMRTRRRTRAERAPSIGSPRASGTVGRTTSGPSPGAAARPSQICGNSMNANYVNEQADTGVAHSSYGESKYRRLARIKGRYDPMNVFRLNQNIEPARP